MIDLPALVFWFGFFNLVFMLLNLGKSAAKSATLTLVFRKENIILYFGGRTIELPRKLNERSVLNKRSGLLLKPEKCLTGRDKMHYEDPFISPVSINFLLGKWA